MIGLYKDKEGERADGEGVDARDAFPDPRGEITERCRNKKECDELCGEEIAIPSGCSEICGENCASKKKRDRFNETNALRVQPMRDGDHPDGEDAAKIQRSRFMNESKDVCEDDGTNILEMIGV